MEKIVEQTLLYDFYELLTDHQKEIYEDAVFNDLSLSEIANEQGISRQGVHDLIKRCDRTLNGYEKKLQLIHKFQQTRELVAEIHKLTKQFKETGDCKTFFDQLMPIDQCNQLLGIRDWNPSGMF